MIYAIKYVQVNQPSHPADKTDRGWETWVDECCNDATNPVTAKPYADLNEAYRRRHQFDGHGFIPDKYHTVEEFAS